MLFIVAVFCLFICVYDAVYGCCFIDSLLLFTGKKGLEAFQRMEQLSAQMEDEAYKNQETQITIL